MAKAANRSGVRDEAMAWYSSLLAAMQTSGGTGMVLGRCEMTWRLTRPVSIALSRWGPISRREVMMCDMVSGRLVSIP